MEGSGVEQLKHSLDIFSILLTPIEVSALILPLYAMARAKRRFAYA